MRFMSEGVTRRALAIFDAVCDLSATDRSTTLRKLCGGDVSLEMLVTSLLNEDAQHRTDTESPLPPFHFDVGESIDDSAAMNLDLDVGASVGRYRIVGLIGTGSSGTVFEAERDAPSIRVALKIFRRVLATEGERRRFKREVESLSSCNHPGIVRIHDAGIADLSHGRLPFLAIELVDGTSITQFVRERKLSLKERIGLIIQVCDAIRHAHERGIIHRDIKPSNVLVDRSGRVRIVDFGLAAAIDGHESASMTWHGSGASIQGTIGYASPEQLSDIAAAEPKSDVYSIGILAYEVLSGHRAFAVEQLGFVDALSLVLETEPPSLGSLNAGLGGDIDAVVTKAIRKDPNQRIATCLEFAHELMRVVERRPVRSRPIGLIERIKKMMLRNPVFFAAALAAIAAGGVGGVFAVVNYRSALDSTTALSSILAKLVEERALAERRGTPLHARLIELQLVVEQATQAEGRRPRNVDIASARATAELALAGAMIEAGEFSTARGRIEKLIPELEALGASCPENLEVARTGAESRVKLGDTFKEEGLPEQAIGPYRQAHEALLGLEKRFRNDRRIANDIVCSFQRLGWIALNTGRWKDAEVLLRSAQQRAKDGLARTPVEPMQIYSMQIVLTLLAEVCARLGKESENSALQLELQSLGSHRSGLKALPFAGAMYLDELSRAMAEGPSATDRNRRRLEIDATANEARLADDFRNLARYIAAARARSELGSLLALVGDGSAAMQEFDCAVRHAQAVVEKSPSHCEARCFIVEVMIRRCTIPGESKIERTADAIRAISDLATIRTSPIGARRALHLSLDERLAAAHQPLAVTKDFADCTLAASPNDCEVLLDCSKVDQLLGDKVAAASKIRRLLNLLPDDAFDLRNFLHGRLVELRQ